MEVISEDLPLQPYFHIDFEFRAIMFLKALLHYERFLLYLFYVSCKTYRDIGACYIAENNYVDVFVRKL